MNYIIPHNFKNFMADLVENIEDLELLIDHFILVGNSLKGKKRPCEERFRFVEPLSKKAISHIVSALTLYKGTKIQLSDSSYVEFVDFSSIAVVTRAAIETYLTFNQIYIEPRTKEEKDFRFLSWDLAGFIERERFSEISEKAKKCKNDEKKLKEMSINNLKKNMIYDKLSLEDKKRILSGNWRLNQSWTDLAKKANIDGKFFSDIYSYLCSYSHSGRLSILQIEQVKEIINEKSFGRVFLTINLIIIARLLIGYVNLIPDCQKAFYSNERAAYLTNIWNKVCDEVSVFNVKQPLK
jgi:hypothetical protein